MLFLHSNVPTCALCKLTSPKCQSLKNLGSNRANVVTAEIRAHDNPLDNFWRKGERWGLTSGTNKFRFVAECPHCDQTVEAVPAYAAVGDEADPQLSAGNVRHSTGAAVTQVIDPQVVEVAGCLPFDVEVRAADGDGLIMVAAQSPADVHGVGVLTGVMRRYYVILTFLQYVIGRSPWTGGEWDGVGDCNSWQRLGIGLDCPVLLMPRPEWIQAFRGRDAQNLPGFPLPRPERVQVLRGRDGQHSAQQQTADCCRQHGEQSYWTAEVWEGLERAGLCCRRTRPGPFTYTGHLSWTGVRPVRHSDPGYMSRNKSKVLNA